MPGIVSIYCIDVHGSGAGLRKIISRTVAREGRCQAVCELGRIAPLRCMLGPPALAPRAGATSLAMMLTRRSSMH